MAPTRTLLLLAVALAIAAVASAIRPSSKLDQAFSRFQTPTGEPRRSCHAALSAMRVMGRADASMPKGLHDLLARDGSSASGAVTGGGVEGVLCTWEEVLPGLDLCTANWNTLNKTLTPSGDVSRAAANLFAKGYVCGLNADATSCAAVKHCTWEAALGTCALSKFYYTLQYSCHDSLVRNVSICIDDDAASCAADSRCKWFEWPESRDAAGDAAVCLPADTPADWSLNDVSKWLQKIFSDEASFAKAWGTCATTEAWTKLMGCSKHETAGECGADELCAWADYLHVCALKPEQFVNVLWGGDTKTVDAVNQRQVFCGSKRGKEACIHASVSIAQLLQEILSV